MNGHESIESLLAGVDLRPLKVWPARAQGSRPTCMAFAVTAAHEARRGKPFHQLSEASLEWSISQVRNQHAASRSGVSFAVAGTALQQLGQVARVDWVFGNSGGPAVATSISSGLWRKAKLVPVAIDIDAMGEEIRSGKPVVVGLPITPQFLSYSGASLFEPVPRLPRRFKLHTVTALGVTKFSGEPVLVARNSWGAGWGDEGYCYLHREFIELSVFEARALDLTSPGNYSAQT